MTAIQGTFERIAINRLVRRNAAANSPAPAPTMIFALSDLTKISVNPTSWYHHQSIIREIMPEKKIKVTKTKPKNIQEKNLVMFIKKPANFVLAGYN